MIIVYLKGGLGNQMFQYALGRRLSLELKMQLKLDLGWFKGQQKREFELSEFNLPENLALPDFLYKFPPFSHDRLIDKFYFHFNRSIPANIQFVLNEDSNGSFDPRILEVKGSKYLDGYWQSEKYFESVKDQIRSDFTLRKALSAQDQALALEMRSNPRSVSVHVRRGDYVSDSSIINRHYVCTPDYYLETMDLMRSKLGNGIVFYVFSDDPEWCRSEMKYPSDHMIVSDGHRSVPQELDLMSNCQNSIMTNSSFSWWGAWLKDHPQKIVIYPKIWFYNRTTPDLPLEHWQSWQHNTENDWMYIDIPFAKSQYFKKIGQELNLEDPQRFTEKIQWLKIFNRNPQYTNLADKCEVRDYVAKKIGSQYLTKYIGVYSKSSEINWGELPRKFVLKPNHGSHWIIRCENKNRLNIKKACKKLDTWLGKNFYFVQREWQYKNISPKIICEEFLEGDKKLGLLEYKFWCFNGIPKYIEIVYNRFYSTQRTIYDLNWRKVDIQITYPNIDRETPRPEGLSNMLEIAKCLSEGLPFVRVDLYNFNHRIYFGELTLTPAGGFQRIQPTEFDFTLGRELVLPQ